MGDWVSDKRVGKLVIDSGQYPIKLPTIIIRIQICAHDFDTHARAHNNHLPQIRPGRLRSSAVRVLHQRRPDIHCHATHMEEDELESPDEGGGDGEGEQLGMKFFSSEDMSAKRAKLLSLFH